MNSSNSPSCTLLRCLTFLSCRSCQISLSVRGSDALPGDDVSWGSAFLPPAVPVCLHVVCPPCCWQGVQEPCCSGGTADGRALCSPSTAGSQVVRCISSGAGQSLQPQSTEPCCLTAQSCLCSGSAPAPFPPSASVLRPHISSARVHFPPVSVPCPPTLLWAI